MKIYAAGFAFAALCMLGNPCFSEVDSLLWKIEGNGLNEPSYLYGAIHAVCMEDLAIGDHLKNALKTSQRLVLEIDISDPGIAMKIALLSRNPSGANLQDRLEEDDRKLLDDFLYQHYGYGLKQLGALKPFALMSMILAKLVPCDQPTSYEAVLTQMALADSIPVAGLETPEYQVGIFDEIPQDYLLNELVRTARDFESSQEEYLQLAAAYRRRDIRQMERLILRSENLGEFKDILFDRRNGEWLPKIENLIAEGPVFIAVGAGHLLSDKGLIELLREKGYAVEPVEF